MNSFKKMEILLDELSEDFNDHLAKSKETFYHVMNNDANNFKLNLSVYSKGGNIECEILLLPDSNSQHSMTCDISLDGGESQSLSGIIIIMTLPLGVGYHTLEFTTGEGCVAARVRLSGALSDSKEISANETNE